ncbi:MAG: hypothetical protein KAS72_15655, partial [Phycisphaerales bacterium]|nr:hypothetical protein [Phycisphaerales bacterium]
MLLHFFRAQMSEATNSKEEKEMRIAIALIAGTAIAATASAQLEVGQGTVAGGWIDAEIMQLREDGNAVLTVNLVNT